MLSSSFIVGSVKMADDNGGGTNSQVTRQEERQEKRVKANQSQSFLTPLKIMISLAIPVTINIYPILHDKRQLDFARETRIQDAYVANRTRWNDWYIANQNLKDSLLKS